MKAPWKSTYKHMNIPRSKKTGERDVALWKSTYKHMNIPSSKNTGERDVALWKSTYKHMNIPRSKNTDRIDKAKQGLCHKINIKYFLSPSNEMHFSDRQLHLTNRQ